MKFNGFLRPDGTVGIRNKLLIIAVDECCEWIARSIAKTCDDAVVLTNSYTCMLGGNEETLNQMLATGKNPNVAGALVIAMGCGSISPYRVAEAIGQTGKSVETLICQDEGGTRKAVASGVRKLNSLKEYADSLKRQEFPLSRLGRRC